MNIPQAFVRKSLTKFLNAIFSFAYQEDRIDKHEFINQVLASCEVELHVSKIALKDFSIKTEAIARKIISDYSTVCSELRRIAVLNGISVVEYPKNIAMEKARELVKNEKIHSGDNYVKYQITAHEYIIEIFQRAGSSDNNGIADFAKQTIPTLQSNLKILLAAI